MKINPASSHPLLTGTAIIVSLVVVALMLAIGFYVRDTNHNTNVERREVREHRIANEASHNVGCRNQERNNERLERIEAALGIETAPNGDLECPEPRHFDETGLGQ